VPASSGAKASLACEERQLVGCARASTLVAEVGERRPGSEKHEPLANGTCGRGPGSQRRFHKKPNWDSKASTIGTAVAKPRCRERPEPGVREDAAGQRFSRDGRHSRSILWWARSREPAGGGLGGSRGVSVNVRTVTASRERRQGCQRLGTHASRREDNAHRDDRPTQRGHVRPAEASLL
jgi:hypothetical protein